ncbi:hypothetical protein HNQ91_002822 [Filimonas zeae]|uniref:Uncharacterized protein n=1 Tax=Filimonas zeae TaxID=1737353 RepID=A0A917J0I1_9BACT|nr:hypothetical protein [Filimonas zeae]MDR6339757.1 hypothetical protein [Filimonas zeae]GGH69498.1 hypothetical protein GCM10011379_26860 [Filimonas zeae]
MENEEFDKGKNIVIVGELPFFYDPADKAVQEMLKRSEQVGSNASTYEIRLTGKGKKKKVKE